MKTIEFTVRGLIKGMPRTKSRAFKKGGKIISTVYTPKTADAWKSLVREAALKAYGGPVLTGPIAITVVARMSRPKSHYRTGKYSDQLKEFAPRWYTKKPDSDNIEKGIWDAISDTGAIWKDDAQIVLNKTLVIYDDTQPGADILIFDLEEYE